MSGTRSVGGHAASEESLRPGEPTVQHTDRAHARLSASSSYRWMMCPPSVILSEQFADTPSQYAEEGTYLHELCEMKLRRRLDVMPEKAHRLPLSGAE